MKLDWRDVLWGLGEVRLFLVDFEFLVGGWVDGSEFGKWGIEPDGIAPHELSYIELAFSHFIAILEFRAKYTEFQVFSNKDNKF